MVFVKCRMNVIHSFVYLFIVKQMLKLLINHIRTFRYPTIHNMHQSYFFQCNITPQNLSSCHFHDPSSTSFYICSYYQAFLAFSPKGNYFQSPWNICNAMNALILQFLFVYFTYEMGSFKETRWTKSIKFEINSYFSYGTCDTIGILKCKKSNHLPLWGLFRKILCILC